MKIRMWFAVALISWSTCVFSADEYEIEAATNDETFIINGEVFKAKTYCLGWDEGDKVIFVEGSPYGACVSAILFNLWDRETCDVWCE